MCCDTWHANFTLASRAIGLFKSFFRKKVTAGRKQRWIQHQKMNAVHNPKLPPTPCFMRWTTWIKSCMYHAEVINLYSAFFASECCVNESETLKELKLIFDDEETLQLKIQLMFISEHGKEMIDTVEFFEVKDTPKAPSL